MVLPVSVDATWLNPASVQLNAQELRRADSALFNGDGSAFGVLGGIVRHGDLSLAVTVNASDVITVQPGAVVVPGNAGVGNGCYRTALGAADTGNLLARNATNPRIDLVVFRVLDTDVVGTHGAYTGRVEVITGTPAAAPVVPALPTLAVELARITVPAAAGGTATVDSSFRTFAVALGGTLPVATFARLPTTDVKWDTAVAVDTGIRYLWNGTGWSPVNNKTLDYSTATATVNTTTPGPTVIGGLSRTVQVGSTTDVLFVTLELDVSTSGAVIFSTRPRVDGANVTPDFTFNVPGGRFPHSKTWRITGLAPGSRTISASVTWAAGASVDIVSATTGLLVEHRAA